MGNLVYFQFFEFSKHRNCNNAHREILFASAGHVKLLSSPSTSLDRPPPSQMVTYELTTFVRSLSSFYRIHSSTVVLFLRDFLFEHKTHDCSIGASNNFFFSLLLNGLPPRQLLAS